MLKDYPELQECLDESSPGWLVSPKTDTEKLASALYFITDKKLFGTRLQALSVKELQRVLALFKESREDAAQKMPASARASYIRQAWWVEKVEKELERRSAGRQEEAQKLSLIFPPDVRVYYDGHNVHEPVEARKVENWTVVLDRGISTKQTDRSDWWGVTAHPDTATGGIVVADRFQGPDAENKARAAYVAFKPGAMPVYVKAASHRAREKLQSALGYKPQSYYTLKQGAQWYRIRQNELSKVLDITGVTKSRIPSDAARTWSGGQEESEAAMPVDEAISDELLRKRAIPGKSFLKNNVWWTIVKRDLDANKVWIVTSSWAEKDGVKKQAQTVSFTELGKNINSGKWGIAIDGRNYGAKQDRGDRADQRKDAGLSKAPGTPKSESTLPWYVGHVNIGTPYHVFQTADPEKFVGQGVRGYATDTILLKRSRALVQGPTGKYILNPDLWHANMQVWRKHVWKPYYGKNTPFAQVTVGPDYVVPVQFNEPADAKKALAAIEADPETAELKVRAELSVLPKYARKDRGLLAAPESTQYMQFAESRPEDRESGWVSIVEAVAVVKLKRKDVDGIESRVATLVGRKLLKGEDKQRFTELEAKRKAKEAWTITDTFDSKELDKKAVVLSRIKPGSLWPTTKGSLESVVVWVKKHGQDDLVKSIREKVRRGALTPEERTKEEWAKPDSSLRGYAESWKKQKFDYAKSELFGIIRILDLDAATVFKLAGITDLNPDDVWAGFKKR